MVFFVKSLKDLLHVRPQIAATNTLFILYILVTTGALKFYVLADYYWVNMVNLYYILFIILNSTRLCM